MDVKCPKTTFSIKENCTHLYERKSVRSSELVTEIAQAWSGKVHIDGSTCTKRYIVHLHVTSDLSHRSSIKWFVKIHIDGSTCIKRYSVHVHML